MARQQKLNVFRTPIGFHDAYVAAPSRKAALAAWGSDADLFARGVAELVTDDALSAEPLAHPGKVIRRLRGTAEEQIAALPADPSGRKSSPSKGTSAPPPKPEPAPKPAPRPSRDRLDAAERELAATTERQQQELAEIRERQRALDRERRDLETRHERERQVVGQALEKERKLYAQKLAR
ncbi:hypothetical protein PK98_09035 [Croceibacterium mercuriale]|uniref:Cell envelope biogenesis protein TolA n=1 Tax=Croceibacterium mercuriale TaxID=1572751 RepID=A0A0B2C2Y0_9SPHN|nr:hypothetical protein [Croceibacterium mercuriale]KHL26530.1 hypothetical protein PK98_09035 [Croceibacterium mercuriale]